ncbi:sporulation protein YlmC with PRC-barrel domain [Pararhizobium capsulatum DSM 1112]|uniref:Sporulation protein YlmC with PRC-barrel domain n=1 Tax=Pararhizobium capsulatum DSM 1112 TaxID=1121113 RepID=A0ABU0BLZ0_9HYPH|nr:PRC-barrel domain-containing protein [Pararhizobium capsulatum]MDQ0319249.1 sporulation protein YlmC with PRC-barrel domain [Pararhizobium capsulatum DSM 1112]
MFRTLLATTGLTLVLAASPLTFTFAQEATAPAAAVSDPGTPEDNAATFPGQLLASSLLGKTVYTGVDEEGEAIGDVNDVIINPTGGTEALVIGVGGFLGIGEKDVAIGFDRMSWSDKEGHRILVVTATKEQLMAEPAFERKPIMDAMVSTPASDQTAENPAATTPDPSQTVMTEQPASGTTPQMTDPDLVPGVDPSTTASATPAPELSPVDPALLSAEKLIGTEVKVADDTKVGEIGDVILGKNGQVEAYIVDVGGFLGMGAKPMAMSAQSVQVMADADGAMTIYSPFTKAQLESQPAYDEQAYKANPSSVLLATPAQ